MENYIPDWLMQAIVTMIVLPIISYSGNAFISKKFNKDNSHTQGKMYIEIL